MSDPAQDVESMLGVGPTSMDVESVVTNQAAGTTGAPVSVRLDSLPIVLREVLTPFDVDSNGVVVESELAKFGKEVREMQAGSMPLTCFKAEQRDQLAKFDADGGGKLDAEEIVSAFKALQKAIDASKSGTIPFENFPKEMQEKLRQLDSTGDGQLDAQEILAGIEALQREKDRAAMLKKAVIGLSVFIFFLLILIGLVMGIVLEITRQTGLSADKSGDAVMKSKDGKVVAVGSTDVQMSADGSMRAKPTSAAGSSRRSGGGCPNVAVIDDDESSAMPPEDRRRGLYGEKKWGRSGPPSMRQSLLKKRRSVASLRQQPDGQTGSESGSGFPDGSRSPEGSSDGKSLDAGDMPPDSEDMDEDEEICEFAPRQKVDMGTTKMKINSQMSLEQLKSIKSFTLEQDGSVINLEVIAKGKIPCDSIICNQANPDGMQLILVTPLGDIVVNGFGEVEFHDDSEEDDEDRDDHDDYDDDGYNYGDDGDDFAWRRRGGRTKTKAKNATPKLSGNRLRLSKFFKKAGFKPAKNGRRLLGTPPMTACEVLNVDMMASPPAPWDTHEIKPAGPPQYYHAKSVLYRRCADQDACMNKEGPYSPFLEGVKAQQSLRTEYGDLLEPYSVEESMRFKTKFKPLKMDGTVDPAAPEQEGVFSIKQETFVAYPDQKKVTLTTDTGMTFVGQIYKGGDMSSVEWFHCRIEAGEMGVEAMPTTVQAPMPMTHEDDVMMELKTPKEIKTHNNLVFATAPEKAFPLYDCRNCGSLCGDTCAGGSGGNAAGSGSGGGSGIPVLPECPKHVKEVEEGCWHVEHASPDGRDTVDEFASADAHLEGHADHCNPTKEGCVPDWHLHKYVLVPKVSNAPTLYYWQTEPGTYVLDEAMNEYDFKHNASKGISLPFAVQAPALGWHKEYPFITALEPGQTPPLPGGKSVADIFNLDRLVSKCEATARERIPPPFIDPATRAPKDFFKPDSDMMGKEFGTPVPSIATHLEYMTGTPPDNCGGGAGGGATDWLCSTDNYLMPGPDVPLDLGYVYKTDIYCSCASTGVDAASGLEKYAIIRSQDSLVVDQGYPMAEFKGSVNRDKLKEGKFDEAVSVDSTFKSKDLPMSDLYDLQRGIEQMLPMEFIPEKVIRDGRLRLEARYDLPQLSAFDPNLRPALVVEGNIHVEQSISDKKGDKEDDPPLFEDWRGAGDGCVDETEFYQNFGTGKDTPKFVDIVNAVDNGQTNCITKADRDAFLKKKTVDREDLGEMSREEMDVRVVLEARTECKANMLVQRLSAKAFFSLQAQVVFPYYELKMPNGTAHTQMYQMCAEWMPLEPTPTPPGQTPSPISSPTSEVPVGGTPPPVGGGAPPVTTTLDPGGGFRRRAPAALRRGVAAEYALAGKPFPGSRRALLQTFGAFGSATGNGDGAGSGSSLEAKSDLDMLLDAVPSDEDMEEEMQELEATAVRTYCLRVQKQGRKWKAAVVPINVADSVTLFDVPEQAIPGSSC